MERKLGSLPIRSAYASVVDNPRRPFVFQLVTNEHAVYLFQAKSAQDRKVGVQWWSSLRCEHPPNLHMGQAWCSLI